MLLLKEKIWYYIWSSHMDLNAIQPLFQTGTKYSSTPFGDTFSNSIVQAFWNWQPLGPLVRLRGQIFISSSYYFSRIPFFNLSHEWNIRVVQKGHPTSTSTTHHSTGSDGQLLIQHIAILDFYMVKGVRRLW